MLASPILALASLIFMRPLGPESFAAPRPGLDSAPLEWGQYSPFAPAPSAIDAATPAGCRLTFGLVLSRHGARYPTAAKAEAYRALVRRIQAAVADFGPGYGFIRRFAPDPRADALTPLGEREMAASGAAFFRRYEALAAAAEPFVRASGSPRVVASAQNFTRGFYAAQRLNPADALADILVLPEEQAFNSTLDHGACTAFERGPASRVGRRRQAPWLERWAAPIAARLNENLPGANLTLREAVSMMDLCPFDSVASPRPSVSDFCGLFSRREWRGYDYYQSLGKWYGFGGGNALGPTQGVGYVNELVARLTGRAVRDRTTTNSTLDASPETFPLDRTLYADFSHDNTMTSVYAALGLYNATADLPSDRRLSPSETHGYSAAWTVPFAARMYVEKMRCGGGDDDEELVRVLVNDRVVPLQGCAADELGRCRLGAFVDSLAFARAGGLWDACFAQTLGASVIKDNSDYLN